MGDLYTWKIYCETEAIWVEGIYPAASGTLMVCPNNSGHTVTSGSQAIAFINSEDTLTTGDNEEGQILVADGAGGSYWTGVSGVEHGDLGGLADDDHTQYLLSDGTRQLTGDWSFGSYTISGTGELHGSYIYGDGSNLTNIDHNDLLNIGITTHSGIDVHIANTTIHTDTDTNLAYLGSITNEPTGFPNRTDSQITFVSGTRTFSIQPSVTSFDYYIQGEKFTVSGTDFYQIDDTEGLWYFYYDGDTLSGTQTFSSNIITEKALVAAVYWNANNDTAIYFGDERHGLTMDGPTHAYLHSAFGARWRSGLALSNITADGDGNSNSHAQISVEAGTILDEDLLHSIATKSFPAQISVWYKSGSEGYWRKDSATTFPVKSFVGGSNLLAWNEWTGATWQQTEVANTDFVLAHIFATNDINDPIISIQGEDAYTNITAAREGAADEINNLFTGGMPFVEFVPLGTLIYQTRTSYTNAVQARIRTTDTGEDYVDWRDFNLGTGGSTNDHGNLSGLGDDDHTQYLLTNGARQLSGDWDFGPYTISGTGDIHGTYIYGDGSNLTNIDHGQLLNIGTTTHSGIDAHIADTNIHHDRLHTMSGTLDHTAGNWKVFYSDGSGYVQELPLASSGTVLTSHGTATAPVFELAANVTKYVTTISGWTLSGGIYYADVTHNLGTKDVVVEIYSLADDETVGMEEVDRIDDNTIRIWSATNSENVRVVVLGTLPGVSPDNHNIQSHTDTSATGAQLDELTGGGNTLLHSHASHVLPVPTTDQTASGTLVVATVDTNPGGAGTALYMAADGHFDAADASSASTMPCRVLATESGTGTRYVLMEGFVKNSIWTWTPGQDIYISTVAGELTHTVASGTGEQVQKVGYAWSADTLYFDPGDWTVIEVA